MDPNSASEGAPIHHLTLPVENDVVPTSLPPGSLGGAIQVNVGLNWFEELKHGVPVQ